MIEEILLVNKDNLLDKYYIQKNLIIIDEPTGEKADKTYKNMLAKEAYIAFKEMQKEALEYGYKIFVDSSYRSYEYQEQVYKQSILKNGIEYTTKYCAIPGASEHQTGLACDIIVCREGQMIEEPTETDEELIWCMKNCYKYGFILRYPKGKESITGYNFEPWHYRYVGKEISNYMKSNKINTLEELVYQNNKSLKKERSYGKR